jgi:coenzyme F420-0:L-glutamate ligase / coenzyme F420-1:gamma-L-glutamate ligase
MAARSVSLSALRGIPLVKAGDDLGALLIAAMRQNEISPRDKDVLVVAQKVVSKSEGRFVDLKTVQPTARAMAVANEVRKDPRLVEVVLSESRDVIRMKPDVLIVEHKLGFVMANAGVDQSNVADEGADQVLLLPRDPDTTAANLKARLDREFAVELAVIINDSFGRPWRLGVVGIALGVAGLPAIVDMIGLPDLFGRKLRVTSVAVADEIAAAASLLMGQSAEGQPAVLVRGFDWTSAARPASALLRPKDQDLFR